MSLRIRRVVTGHSPEGKAIVASDETLPVTIRRPGQDGCVVWWTSRIPANNLDPTGGSQPVSGTTTPEGAVFRIVRYAAGTAGRMHRTDSLDYGIVLNGSIVLELDDSAQVELHAGDVLVQRGTIHNWINRSAESCTVAFVLLGAAAIAAD